MVELAEKIVLFFVGGIWLCALIGSIIYGFAVCVAMLIKCGLIAGLIGFTVFFVSMCNLYVMLCKD